MESINIEQALIIFTITLLLIILIAFLIFKPNKMEYSNKSEIKFTKKVKNKISKLFDVKESFNHLTGKKDIKTMTSNTPLKINISKERSFPTKRCGSV